MNLFLLSVVETTKGAGEGTIGVFIDRNTLCIAT